MFNGNNEKNTEAVEAEKPVKESKGIAFVVCPKSGKKYKVGQSKLKKFLDAGYTKADGGK